MSHQHSQPSHLRLARGIGSHIAQDGFQVISGGGSTYHPQPSPLNVPVPSPYPTSSNYSGHLDHDVHGGPAMSDTISSTQSYRQLEVSQSQLASFHPGNLRATARGVPVQSSLVCRSLPPPIQALQSFGGVSPSTVPYSQAAHGLRSELTQRNANFSQHPHLSTIEHFHLSSEPPPVNNPDPPPSKKRRRNCKDPPNLPAPPQPAKPRKTKALPVSEEQHVSVSPMRREANGPSVDGRHHPTPAAPPLALVNNLETAIAEKAHVHSVLSDHIASNPSPTPDHEPTSVIPSAPPLGDLEEHQTPAHSKRGRSPPLPAPKPYSILLQESIGKLIAEAQDRSKGAMSDADRQFFVDFQAEQRKILAIKAIERGVSVAMVEKYLGKCQPMRKLSTWQNFMKTEPARERFRGRGKGGVAQNHPMGWWQEVTSSCRGSLWVVDVIDGLTATERALDDSEQEGHQAVQNVTHSSPAVDSREMRGTVSMAGASVKVQDFVDEWVIKANSVAETYKCDMILFTASRYLGANSYQYTTSTHRASPFVQLADDLDGQNTYGTRFHGWLVGQSSEAIAAQAEPENSIRPRTTNVKARLARLIGKKTENIWTKWPWTDCEKVLAKHGFELVLHPKIRTERHIFNRPGKHLLAPDIQALHLDLDNKYIDVVRVPRRNSSRSPSITPSERSRSSSSSSQTSSSSRSGSACQISPGHASEESEGLASRKQSRETLPSRPVVHLVPKNPPLQVGPLLRPL
ncbi:hypothetical protein PSHT_13346 [Puccinia striiformis]|uniref:Uncharacterized protein n=1 Tax=Puccinia striiformis TaxID=27350 RepID=A0A2S4URD6_9BASI|nr:hypothetical protein PSHT_13346 [Puccinia striiformis]